MFVICDQNDVVRDIATEETNLSRGWTFPGVKLYTDVKEGDIQIGDIFKNGTLTKNQELRNQQQQQTANEKAIQQKLREIAILELTKDGQWPAEIQK